VTRRRASGAPRIIRACTCRRCSDAGVNGKGPPAGSGPTSLKAEAERVWQATLDESKLYHGAGFSVQAGDPQNWPKARQRAKRRP
jgi:hypothetical protein